MEASTRREKKHCCGLGHRPEVPKEASRYPRTLLARAAELPVDTARLRRSSLTNESLADAGEGQPQQVQARTPTIANKTPTRDKTAMIPITSQQNRSSAVIHAISANGTLFI